MKHYENYKDIKMNKTKFEKWFLTFIIKFFLNEMNYIIDNFIKNNIKLKVIIKNLNFDKIIKNILKTISKIININNIFKFYEIITFNNFILFTKNIIINIIIENIIKNHCNNLSYFIIAFFTFFSYETDNYNNKYYIISLFFFN